MRYKVATTNPGLLHDVTSITAESIRPENFLSQAASSMKDIQDTSTITRDVYRGGGIPPPRRHFPHLKSLIFWLVF